MALTQTGSNTVLSLFLQMGRSQSNQVFDIKGSKHPVQRLNFPFVPQACGKDGGQPVEAAVKKSDVNIRKELCMFL